MMYKALRQWRDLEDDHIYNAGDAFPHDGREVAPARLAALSTDANKAHLRLIEAMEEQGKEIPEQASETLQEPRKRGRKPKR